MIFTDFLLLSGLSVFVLVNILFVISLITKRNDMIDVFWGPGILLSSVTLYFSNLNIHKNLNLALLVILTLTLFWAMRIFLHIGIRFINKKAEDFRYKNWRETWKYFYLRSYFQIYILQGFLMFLMSLTIFSFLNYTNIYINNFFVILGTLISVLGLTFEAVSDIQLNRFIKNKSEKIQGNLSVTNIQSSEILTTGLWKYTRHPNYFGEISFWFGILTISLSNIFLNFDIKNTDTYTTLFAFVPFFLILFLILKVSGIPMLESKYKDNKEFEIYKNKTPAFFPDFFIK